MKKYKFTLLAGLLASASFAQTPPNYKQEMIESGEKQEKTVRPENASFAGDFASYRRAKAWNSRVSTTVLNYNTVNIDIPIIGGRVRSSLVDVDNNISLVAPSGGGLWKFSTDGSSFLPVNDFAPFMPITSINQNPFNKQEVIVATGDEQHGVAGNGLFISDDSEIEPNSFTQIQSTDPEQNSDFQYIRFAKYSPQTQNTIYLTSRSKLYKSTDAGTTWALVFDAGRGKDIRSLEFTANTGVMLAVESDGIYTSTTGDNDSFTLLTNGISSGDAAVTNAVVATHAANRNIAYAMIEKDDVTKVFKTTNGGTSWVEKTTPSFTIRQAWFCFTIGVHPTNPDIVVGGSIGWGYTEDGGTTWTTGGDLEVDFHDVHFHPSDPNVAYIGYDQGIGRVDFSKTANQWVWNGQEYVQEEQAEQNEIGKNKGFNTSQIYYGDYYPEAYGDAVLFGQQDGGSFAHVNNIDYRVLVGDGGTMFVNKQDPTKAFGCTQYGRLQYTADALEPSYGDYSSIGNFSNNYPNFITQFAGNNADGNQIYMATNTTIERTIDGGTTFSKIADHNSLKDLKVATEYAANPIVYAIGSDRQTQSWESSLLRIENAATTPVVKTFPNLFDYWSGGSPDQIMVDPNDRNTVYVTTSGGEAFQISGLDTENFTKESIKGNLEDVVFNVVIHPKDKPFLIAGTNVGLFISFGHLSEDGNRSWERLEGIPSTQVTDLRHRESDNRLFVFTYGRGAWATTVDPVTGLDDLQEIAENTSIAYPNPAKDILTIDMEAGSKAILFDQLGRNAAETETNQLDVSSLSTGQYILHVYKDEKLMAIQKIVVE
ncbi:MAG: T9SS type A sorting domain-containing protein [Cytophagales bacterium]|nr:T9SS type A sorting domain-containing protein [Cytophagales bacterium]